MIISTKVVGSIEESKFILREERNKKNCPEKPHSCVHEN
jgi:hypothetical protein